MKTIGNILHITASPRADASFSQNFSKRIVERLLARDPGAVVVRRDFGVIGLPHVDETYGHTLAGSWPMEADAYERPGSLAQSERLISELEAADAVVIGTPMHNYTVPSVLKAWIDHVLRAHRSFGFSPEGKVGLLAERPVYIAVASGGGYIGEGPLQPDFLTPYLEAVFRTIGIRDLHFFPLQRTVAGAEVVAEALRGVEALLDRKLPLPGSVQHSMPLATA